jgi:hypothetical protein
MATRKLVLGSVATLLLSGALIGAPPVLAQSSAAPSAAYSAATARYESALRDYNQKQQAYEQQRDDYDAKLAAYQSGLNARPVIDPNPDVVVVAPDEDTAVVIEDASPDTHVIIRDRDPNVVVLEDSDDFAARLILRDVPPLVRLEDVADVNDAFFNAPVLDSAGLPVGHFRRIETKAPGDLVAVVTLNGSRRTVSMLTDHVRLDPDRGTVIADLTEGEIDLIPSGFPYG